MCHPGLVFNVCILNRPVEMRDLFTSHVSSALVHSTVFDLSCRSIIVQAHADVTMIRDNLDGTFSQIPAYFYTTTRIINSAQEFDIDSILAEFNFKVQQFNRRGSGFELERIVRFVLVINTYLPLHGSTYLPTPDWLERKRCIVNVNNKD